MFYVLSRFLLPSGKNPAKTGLVFFLPRVETRGYYCFTPLGFPNNPPITIGDNYWELRVKRVYYGCFIELFFS